METLRRMLFYLKPAFVRHGEVTGLRIAGWWLYVGLSRFTPGVRI